MIKESLKSIAILFKYARKETVLSLIVLLCSSVITPITIFFTSSLVNSIGPFISGSVDASVLIKWSGLILTTLFFATVLEIFGNIIYISAEKSLNANFSEIILKKFIKLDYRCFEDTEIQDVLTRMGDEPQRKIHDLYVNTTEMISILLKFTGIAFVFMQISIWFSVGFLLLLMPMLWGNYKAEKLLDDMFFKETENLRRLKYFNELLSAKDSLLELRIFRAIGYILKKRSLVASHVVDEKIKTAIKSQKYELFTTILSVLWSLFVMLILVFFLARGMVTIGIFVAITTSMEECLQMMRYLTSSFKLISKQFFSIRHYYSFMGLPEIFEKEDEKLIENPKIVFENVSFKYPKTDLLVLDNISFEISPNVVCLL